MKLKQGILFAACIISLLCARSQVTIVKLTDFNTIQVGENIHAILVPAADSLSMIFRNDSRVKYSFSKNVLQIKARNTFTNNKIITVYISVRNINRLILTGNSSVVTKGILLSDELTISGKDNSICMVETSAAKIKTTQTHGSRISINGQYSIRQSSVNGYGDIILEYVKQEQKFLTKN